MKKKLSKYLILQIVVIGAIIAFALALVFTRISAKRESLRLQITENFENDKFNAGLRKYMIKATSERVSELLRKDSDLSRIYSEDYQCISLSMWDQSALTSDWYEVYFAKTILYTDYAFNNPEELHEYFEALSNSEADIETVYISLDPYALYTGYYASIYYDAESLTYEEYINEYLFKWVEDYPEVDFHFFLPTMPISYWESLSNEEFDEIFANWYTFLMYLRWWPNVSVSYMGDVEWLAVNDSNFESKYVLVDDVLEKESLYLYAYAEYKITPPELVDSETKILELVANKRAGEYDFKGLEGKKLAFYGDSIFAYAGGTISIPGVIADMTGANTYTLAVGGSTAAYTNENSLGNVAGEGGGSDGSDASEKDKNSFVNVAGSGAGADSEKFESEVSADDEVYFIIEYGTNDYYEKLSVNDYKAALIKGAKTLMSKYPNSHIVFVSPYETMVQYEETNISDYVTAMEEAADEMGVTFVNLYADLGINLDNMSEYLIDGTHPDYDTNVWIAREIVDGIVKKR